MNKNEWYLDPNDERFVNNPDYVYDDELGIGWVKLLPIVIPTPESVVVYFVKEEHYAKHYAYSDYKFFLAYRYKTESTFQDECDIKDITREEYEKCFWGPFTFDYQDYCDALDYLLHNHLESEADYMKIIECLQNGERLTDTLAKFTKE